MRYFRVLCLASVALAPDFSRAGDGDLLSGDPVETVETSLAQGHSTYFGPFVTVGINCRKVAESRAWIVEAPRYGRASVIKRRGDIAFQPGRRHSRCNDRPVSGTTIRYTPPVGFSGDDTFAFSVVFSDGEARTKRVNVHVE